MRYAVLLASAEGLAHRVGGGVDEGDELGVVHPRGAEDADCAGDAAVIGVRGDDEAELAPAEIAGLAADVDGDGAGGEGLVEQIDLALLLFRACISFLRRPASAYSGRSIRRDWPSIRTSSRRTLSPAMARAPSSNARRRRASMVTRSSARRRAKRSRTSPRLRPSITSARRLWTRVSSASSMGSSMEEAVLDGAVGEDEDGEELAGARGDEAELGEGPQLFARGGDDGGGAGELGEVAARLAERVVGDGVDFGEALAELGLLFRGEGAHLDERVDEEAGGRGRWGCCRGGVGLLEVAGLLEIVEDVAD